MESAISIQIRDEGRRLASTLGQNLGSTLNEILNGILGFPFHATGGFAVDSDGHKTSAFQTVIYTTGTSSFTESAPVPADSLACVIDVFETLDLETLRVSHDRIGQAKRLKKEPAPHIAGILNTTTTLGIIFSANASVPMEKLAEELDQLNRQKPDGQWPDMIVVLSQGIINYGAQFPGEAVSADYLPPAHGALSIMPVYIVIVMRPTGPFVLNRMCGYLLLHLSIFSPGAKLPNWAEILEGAPKIGITLSGYQYNLRGELLPVPRQFYNDRYFPPQPLRIEDQQGHLLSTVQYLPWQDGGVVILRGKLPLEGLLIFLGPAALKHSGIIKRPEPQISYVLPIT